MMLTRIRSLGLARMIDQKSPTVESLPDREITTLVASIAISTAITGASRAKPTRFNAFMRGPRGSVGWRSEAGEARSFVGCSCVTASRHGSAEVLGGDPRRVEGADHPAPQD